MRGIRITTPSQIGATIRGARVRAGLTQSELADRAGASRRWIITLESGRCERAELGKILDTLDALGLTLTTTAADDRPDGLLEAL